jgi:serine/threonine protein kinase
MSREGNSLSDALETAASGGISAVEDGGALGAPPTENAISLHGDVTPLTRQLSPPLDAVPATPGTLPTIQIADNRCHGQDNAPVGDSSSAEREGEVGNEASPDSVEISPDHANSRIVDEHELLPDASPNGNATRPAQIIDFSGFEIMRELGSSRFGIVRLFRKSTVSGDDFVAAKYYHEGANHERRPFESLVRPFLELSHPHIIPIVGFIPPMKNAGPVIFSPYNESESLEMILTRVRRNDPPDFWTDAGKAFLIAGLLSGLLYLHSRGIFHSDLKPSDLIIDSSGSIAIRDFLTGKLEDFKFTIASQVGNPSYSAPEVSGGCDDKIGRTAKADVFSFGVILYEIVCGQTVFPSTLAPATIWRKSHDPRPGARPVIPASIHPILRSCIQRCWVPDPSKRPKLSDLWQQLRDVRFGFPDAPIHVIRLASPK